MKRFLKILFLSLLFTFIPFSASQLLTSQTANADVGGVYVSSAGMDENDGTENAPYQTLEKALEEVQNHGTIILQGIVKLDSWGSHGKTVTLTGGTLDASGLSEMVINDNVNFENITVKASKIYANGYQVLMDENVTMSENNVYLYGGSVEGSTIASTNLTVLSGTYGYIFGGSYKGKINGDTHLTIGGTTKATYVFGGSDGSSALSSIGGTAYLKISNGTFEGVYGGNQGTNCENDVDLEITGGKFIQVFGGGYKAYLTGNVEIRLLGGTITRRVYGGCYNETSGTSFTTSCYVNGKIHLILGGVNIDFSSSEGDRAIYAHTRHKTAVDTETSMLTFANETSYNKYKDKLKAQDWQGKLLMGSLSAADELHYYTYAQNGTTLTQNCAYCQDFSATVDLSLDETASLVYTGKEIAPVRAIYSENWVGDKPNVVYTNNVEVGVAVCSLTIGKVSLSLDFTIVDTPVVLGGSVRLSNPTGLRFQSIVPTGLKNSGATFGTLIIPKAVLGEQELTHETTSAEDVVQKQWATESVKEHYPTSYMEGYEYFHAVLTEIPAQYYSAEIVARSYVCANGQYYYSEPMTRSIAQISAFALADGYTDSVLYDYVDTALAGTTLTMEKEVEITEDLQEYQLNLLGNTKGYAVIWSSSDSSIITVDDNGYIRVVDGAQGSVVISAKLGSQVVECKVIVVKWSKYY